VRKRQSRMLVVGIFIGLNGVLIVRGVIVGEYPPIVFPINFLSFFAASIVATWWLAKASDLKRKLGSMLVVGIFIGLSGIFIVVNVIAGEYPPIVFPLNFLAFFVTSIVATWWLAKASD